MKKLLGIMAATALAVSAFGQGQVVFNNVTGLVQAWTSATDSTPVTSTKGNAYVELISAPVGTALLTPGVPALGAFPTLASFLAANPGWAASAPITGASNPGGLAINGIFGLGTQNLNVGGGVNANYFVLAWSGPNGGAVGTYNTYDLAMANGNWFGESAIYTTATGDPTTTPPGTAIGLKNTFGGLMTVATAIQPIPEPTSFALAGLGLAALLVFRRRN